MKGPPFAINYVTSKRQKISSKNTIRNVAKKKMERNIRRKKISNRSVLKWYRKGNHIQTKLKCAEKFRIIMSIAFISF